MTKIVVFDDHRIRREALRLLISLDSSMQCIGAYENCSGLVENLSPDPPDVVLMDINMPQVNGIEGVKLLSEHFPKVFIIMQTVYEDDDHLFDALLAGAHGYLLKNTPNDKIIEAIKEVTEGGAPMTPSIARRVITYFNKKPAKKSAMEEYNLSARELEVLECLALGHSQKMVAEKLFLSKHTVGNHIKNIYQKMHVHNLSAAIASLNNKKG